MKPSSPTTRTARVLQVLRELPSPFAAGVLSPVAIAALFSLTILSLMSGCGPTVRGDDEKQNSPFVDPTSFISSGYAQNFSISGAGTHTYPSSGVISTDSRLLVKIASTTATGSSPNPDYHTCQGYTVQLQQVLLDGAVENVGGAVNVAPMKFAAGSAYCDSLAGSLGRTTAPSAIVIDFSSALNSRPAQGYRVRITDAVSDYRRQACMAACSTSFNCGGWASNSTFGAPPEQRCAQYTLQPLYASYTNYSSIDVQVNNQ